MIYIGYADLRNRGWVYTRQGIDYLINNDESFPKPAFTLNGGRVRVWLESDIEDFEDANPRLFDESLKQRYVKGGVVPQIEASS